MKRALLSLLLIVTMVLSVTIASAQDFTSDPGQIDAANGWSTTGTWIAGSYTETQATASHSLKTGASGAFSYEVLFKAGDPGNVLKIGLGAVNGNKYQIVINGNSVTCPGGSLGTLTGDITAANYWAKISSTDGKVWTFAVNDVSATYSVNSVPNSAILDISQSDPDPLVYSPIIYVVKFTSAETGTPTPVPSASPTPVPSASPTPEPSASPTPEPSASPTPAPVVSAPVYDPQMVQDFYDNAYNQIYSPYDIITYNPDGTYTVTPNYPKADGAAAAIPATYAVSGAVTAAADGKPIDGASVVLGNMIQKTDDFGLFRFDGVSKGASDIAVSADGFASKTQAVDVNDNLQLSIALDLASAGSSTVASAANETGNTTVAKNTTMNTTTTVTTTTNNTTNPVPTQTKSPGFEAIVAALSLIAVAGLLLYVNRKK